MDDKYFKLRKTWRPRKNRFDLGPSFNLNLIHISGYFVMRIFGLPEQEYLPFYRYHLKYFLANHVDGSERLFLTKVLEIVGKDVNSRETVDYYNTTSKTRIYKLSRFRNVLKEVDKWDLSLTNDERMRQSISYVQEIMNWQNVNDTKTVLKKLLFDEVGSDEFFIEHKRIIEQKNRLESLLETERLAVKDLQDRLKNIAPDNRITILNGDQKLLIDLFMQLRGLRAPGTDRDFLSAKPELWARLIHNYFTLSQGDGQENCRQLLSYDTILEYFKDNLGKEMLKSKNRRRYFNIKESDRIYN
ncbi:hypothetical protein [Sphingobacterium sp. JB170]|uniref:hypothetical protein n=1 Tax=Sphingobacterium sp. JB170 TaxID=1434842 RepID=UPI00097F5B47|nr:hypothetical protein [Sphingobacterium sp. JB170]SJN49852.1 hypothetical protein FM107_19345 [Sphingobacterium sp. JB170]